MKRPSSRSVPTILRSVPLLSAVLCAGLAPSLEATPPDGIYRGSTTQGRSISVTVSGGRVTSWTVGYLCPGFSSTTTVNTGACSIFGHSFSCGSTFCSPFVSTTRLTGTFSGSSVSGTLDVRHRLNQFASCCVLTGRAWSAVRSCDDLGDGDGDGVCDDVDVCPGFDDGADDDGDGVPDGCDLCLGDDASGDPDGDGLCQDLDVCLGENSAGDLDADSFCADLDCDDGDPLVHELDGCGVCGGDASSCGVFADGFESGDLASWSR